MGIETELAKLQASSAEQTAASKSLQEEVSGKIGEINSALSAAQKTFNDFISGDFSRNVNAAKSAIVFIDPIDGDDSNSGLNSANCIKTSSKLKSLLDYDYDFIRISIRKGTVFYLEHFIIARDAIIIDSWDAKDGATNKPEIRQAAPSHVHLSTPRLHVTNVIISTYRAQQNEVLPDIYKRAFLGSNTQVVLMFADVNINDNQLIHIHDGGSGSDFSRKKISYFLSTIRVLDSESGVTGSSKVIFSRYSQFIPQALDLFGRGLTLELNGHHTNLLGLLGIPSDNILTNNIL